MLALGARNIASDSRNVRGSRAVGYRATGNFRFESRHPTNRGQAPKFSPVTHDTKLAPSRQDAAVRESAAAIAQGPSPRQIARATAGRGAGRRLRRE